MYFGPPEDAKGAKARQKARSQSITAHAKAPPKYDASKRKHVVERNKTVETKKLPPSALPRPPWPVACLPAAPRCRRAWSGCFDAG